MSNTNKYAQTVIDGLEVTVHSIHNVIAGPKDIYTCVLPIEFDSRDGEGPVYAGASIRTTEVTEGIEKHNLQGRIESPYFRRALSDWFATLTKPEERRRLLPMTKDIDEAISQLNYTIRSNDEINLDIGRLYGKKQHMFAKLEFSNSWSLVMHNTRPATAELEFDHAIDKNNGPWGTWKLDTAELGATTGVFQLLHRRSFSPLSRVRETIYFQHSGKVAYESQIEINGWLREEFLNRWGHLLSMSVKETLKFVFDESCIAMQEDSAVRSALPNGYSNVFTPSEGGQPVVQLSNIVAGRELLIDGEWCLIESIGTDIVQGLSWLTPVSVKDSSGNTRQIVVGENARAAHGKSNGYDLYTLQWREKKPSSVQLVALGGIELLKVKQSIWIDNEKYVVQRWTKTRDNAPGVAPAWAITVEDSAGGEFDIVVGDGDLSVYKDCKTFTFGQIGVEYIPTKINKEFGEG